MRAKPPVARGHPKIPVDQTTAIFMECDMVPLPLVVPAGGTIRVIPLNHKQLKSQHWGFFGVHGGVKDVTWPDRAFVTRSAQLHNQGLWAYKCRVSNHGRTNLIYLDVPIDLWFGNQGREQNRLRYAPVISALDSGREFDFYLVNDCNTSVAAIWQDNARVQLLGEPTQRDIPLRRTYRSPADQVMIFFPTTVRWVKQYPECE